MAGTLSRSRHFHFLLMFLSVNAPDALYAAMPVYIYLWPDLLGLLLRPLFEYQETPAYANAYAAQDIGLFDLSIFY